MSGSSALSDWKRQQSIVRAMKIESGKSVGAGGASKRGGGVAAPGFAPEIGGAQSTARTAPASTVAALDAVLALQIEDGPSQRRARQLRRGRDALDALEVLEQGLVLGRAPASLPADLDRLRGQAQATGEEDLDRILLEIDTRLAVEAAKLEMSRVGASVANLKFARS